MCVFNSMLNHIRHSKLDFQTRKVIEEHSIASRYVGVIRLFSLLWTPIFDWLVVGVDRRTNTIKKHVQRNWTMS